MNNSAQTPNGDKWVDANKIDNNYLFCQTEFYTWIKNTPSGTPYNSATPCTPVVCPRGPIVCPSPSPSSSPSSTSSSTSSSSKKCTPCTPVICPVGSPRTNFDVGTCPGPVYSQNQSNDPQYVDLNPPPSFYEADVIPAGMYKPPPPKANSYTNYIIGGVAVVVLGLIYYFVFGPGAEGDSIIPLKKAVKVVKAVKKIGKKVGGYFYYDYI